MRRSKPLHTKLKESCCVNCDSSDVYTKEKKIEAGKIYAVTFLLNDDEQTLTEKQIDKTMERLMLALEKEAGAVIRKG